MSEDLNQRSRSYAERYDVRLTERLGFGIHGIVHVVESYAKPGRTSPNPLPGNGRFWRTATAFEVHRKLDPLVS